MEKQNTKETKKATASKQTTSLKKIEPAKKTTTAKKAEPAKTTSAKKATTPKKATTAKKAEPAKQTAKASSAKQTTAVKKAEPAKTSSAKKTTTAKKTEPTKQTGKTSSKKSTSTKVVSKQKTEVETKNAEIEKLNSSTSVMAKAIKSNIKKKKLKKIGVITAVAVAAMVAVTPTVMYIKLKKEGEDRTISIVHNFESEDDIKVDIKVKKGETVAQLKSKLDVYPGYALEGVYKDEACTMPYLDTDVIGRASRIYVKWVPLVYAITLPNEKYYDVITSDSVNLDEFKWGDTLSFVISLKSAYKESDITVTKNGVVIEPVVSDETTGSYQFSSVIDDNTTIAVILDSFVVNAGVPENVTVKHNGQTVNTTDAIPDEFNKGDFLEITYTNEVGYTGSIDVEGATYDAHTGKYIIEDNVTISYSAEKIKFTVPTLPEGVSIYYIDEEITEYKQVQPGEQIPYGSTVKATYTLGSSMIFKRFEVNGVAGTRDDNFVTFTLNSDLVVVFEQVLSVEVEVTNNTGAVYLGSEYGGFFTGREARIDRIEDWDGSILIKNGNSQFITSGSDSFIVEGDIEVYLIARVQLACEENSIELTLPDGSVQTVGGIQEFSIPLAYRPEDPRSSEYDIVVNHSKWLLISGNGVEGYTGAFEPSDATYIKLLDGIVTLEVSNKAHVWVDESQYPLGFNYEGEIINVDGLTLFTEGEEVIINFSDIEYEVYINGEPISDGQPVLITREMIELGFNITYEEKQQPVNVTNNTGITLEGDFVVGGTVTVTVTDATNWGGDILIKNGDEQMNIGLHESFIVKGDIQVFLLVAIDVAGSNGVDITLPDGTEITNLQDETEYIPIPAHPDDEDYIITVMPAGDGSIVLGNGKHLLPGMVYQIKIDGDSILMEDGFSGDYMIFASINSEELEECSTIAYKHSGKSGFVYDYNGACVLIEGDQLKLTYEDYAMITINGFDFPSGEWITLTQSFVSNEEFTIEYVEFVEVINNTGVLLEGDFVVGEEVYIHPYDWDGPIRIVNGDEEIESFGDEYFNVKGDIQVFLLVEIEVAGTDIDITLPDGTEINIEHGSEYIPISAHPDDEDYIVTVSTFADGGVVWDDNGIEVNLLPNDEYETKLDKGYIHVSKWLNKEFFTIFPDQLFEELEEVAEIAYKHSGKSGFVYDYNGACVLVEDDQLKLTYEDYGMIKINGVNFPSGEWITLTQSFVKNKEFTIEYVEFVEVTNYANAELVEGKPVIGETVTFALDANWDGGVRIINGDKTLDFSEDATFIVKGDIKIYYLAEIYCGVDITIKLPCGTIIPGDVGQTVTIPITVNLDNVEFVIEVGSAGDYPLLLDGKHLVRPGDYAPISISVPYTEFNQIFNKAYAIMPEDILAEIKEFAEIEYKSHSSVGGLSADADGRCFLVEGDELCLTYEDYAMVKINGFDFPSGQTITLTETILHEYDDLQVEYVEFASEVNVTNNTGVVLTGNFVVGEEVHIENWNEEGGLNWDGGVRIVNGDEAFVSWGGDESFIVKGDIQVFLYAELDVIGEIDNIEITHPDGSVEIINEEGYVGVSLAYHPNDPRAPEYDIIIQGENFIILDETEYCNVSEPTHVKIYSGYVRIEAIVLDHISVSKSVIDDLIDENNLVSLDVLYYHHGSEADNPLIQNEEGDYVFFDGSAIQFSAMSVGKVYINGNYVGTTEDIILIDQELIQAERFDVEIQFDE